MDQYGSSNTVPELTPHSLCHIQKHLESHLLDVFIESDIHHIQHTTTDNSDNHLSDR